MCRPPCRSNAPFDRSFPRFCGGGQFLNVPLKRGHRYPSKSPNTDTQELAVAHKVVNLRPSDAKTLARFLWREEQLLTLVDHVASLAATWPSKVPSEADSSACS
jgi:hypothetical protein